MNFPSPHITREGIFHLHILYVYSPSSSSSLSYTITFVLYLSMFTFIALDYKVSCDCVDLLF
jgi:hypothetical protein